MQRIKGKAVSPGIVMGKALLYNSRQEIVLHERIDEGDVEKEIWRLSNAVKKAQAQLKKIHHDLQKMMGKDSALIIETQYMLLKDSNLINDIKDVIRKNLVKAEWAIKEIERKYFDIFNSLKDLSFKEKSNDISDALSRIIANLMKNGQPEMKMDLKNFILVADSISPSEAAKLMSRKQLLGLVLNKGGETSHTVILARAMGIPAILETIHATEWIADGDWIAVDSIAGEVVVNPTRNVVAEITIKQNKYRIYKERLRAVAKLPDLTRDEKPFHLYANIELPFESETIQAYGARGIGLFRTEFLYLDSKTSLAEEEQCLIYKNIAQRIYPHPLVIRTFDLGRDKIDSQTDHKPEENPSLGMMAVRLFLKKKDLFKTQIRAIQRANDSGNIRILFPMISEIEEIHAVRDLIRETREELVKEGRFPKKEIKVGIMLEIPAAVKLIPHVKEEIDFFSVGTNDLIQYLLAVDRNNSAVSYLFSPFHPAVVQTLDEIRREAEKIGKEVTICGEMAGMIYPALMLLGIGFTRFSMNPLAIAEIKRVFTGVRVATVRNIVRRLLTLSSRTEIEEYLVESLLRKYPKLFIHQTLL
jgi:phosphotransferase system enzyme I (PtsI)